MPDTATKPAPSATVILADPDGGGDEPFAIYLLERAAASRFMPGRFVFPGGRVEPADGVDPLDRDTLARTAIRELFEEAGVLLAQGRPAAPQRLAEVRRSLQRGLTTLDLALDTLKLRADLGALKPVARWITPAARPRRFDTTFFLAAMPPGQEATSDQQETSAGLWLTPSAALAQNQAGQVALAPPVVRILGQLSDYPSLQALFDAKPDLTPVEPVLWAQDGERVILLPDDPDHAHGRPRSPGRPAPANRATRLVHRDGVWLPYQA